MLALHELQQLAVYGPQILSQGLGAVVQPTEGAKAPDPLRRVGADGHALPGFLRGIHHGENDAVGAALDDGLDIAHLVIRHPDEGAAAAGIGGDDGVFDHGLGHARVLVVDPHIVVTQKAAHLIEVQLGVGAVGTEAQAAGGQLVLDPLNVVHGSFSSPWHKQKVLNNL